MIKLMNCQTNSSWNEKRWEKSKRSWCFENFERHALFWIELLLRIRVGRHIFPIVGKIWRRYFTIILRSARETLRFHSRVEQSCASFKAWASRSKGAEALKAQKSQPIIHVCCLLFFAPRESSTTHRLIFLFTLTSRASLFSLCHPSFKQMMCH